MTDARLTAVKAAVQPLIYDGGQGSLLEAEVEELATKIATAALEAALMTEADLLDKKYWAMAKADFQAKTLNMAGSPTWEELTDGQRNSLRWLAQRRQEREDLKDVTFALRYGMNYEGRMRGEQALAAFDQETRENTPFTLVGFNEAIAQQRIDAALAEHVHTPACDPDFTREDAQLAAGRFREAYPELMRIAEGRALTSDDVGAPPSMQTRLNGLGYHEEHPDA